MDINRMPRDFEKPVHHHHPYRDIMLVVSYTLLTAAAFTVLTYFGPITLGLKPVAPIIGATLGAMWGVLLGIGKVKSLYRDYQMFGTLEKD